MKSLLFTFDGIKGRATREGAVLFVQWGGIGFHIEGAGDKLRDAILAAEKAA